MAKIRFLFFLALVLLICGLATSPHAQTLSSQVLQLLTRANTWTGQQTFQNLRVSLGLPADTTYRVYNVNGTLYWNGLIIAGSGGGPALHGLLSSTHSDTSPANALRGGVIVGSNGGPPVWTQLAIGTAGSMLRSTGLDVAWSTDGQALTNLNASALASGTVPAIRLSNIGNAQIDAAAGIGWAKIDKAGSSLADLTTVSASNITSGLLPDARLGPNVSLFGALVDTAELATGAVTFAKWASNGCASGDYPQYSGGNWICGTVAPGLGTVTSVAVVLPAIFNVAGSPITANGIINATLATQTAGLVWAGPSSGAAAAPTFRNLTYTDFPTSAAAAGTYPKVTINAQGIVTGFATQITLTTDVVGTLPLVNGGTGLNAASDDTLLLSNGVSWAAAPLSTCATAMTYNAATNTFGCNTGVGAHALLSASHSDTLAAAVTAGDLLIGSAVPQWTRLAIGASGTVLISNGSSPQWDTFLSLSGVSLTSLGATEARLISGSAVNTATTAGSQNPGYLFASRHIEYSSGVHGLTYGTLFSETLTNGGATTTTIATVYIDDVVGKASAGTAYSLYSAGLTYGALGYRERARTVNLGEWASTPYAGGDYTTNGAGGWTVDSGDVVSNSISLVGKTATFAVKLTTTTVTAAVGSQLRVAIPGGLIWDYTCGGSFAYDDNGTRATGHWQATSGNTYLTLEKDLNAPNWTASSNATAIDVTATCAIQ